MGFAIDRRRVLSLMSSALAATAVFGTNSASAAALVSAFAQSVAAAAQGDDALADFYRNRNYATLWTGDVDIERRHSLIAAFDAAPAHGLPAARYSSEALHAQFASVQTEGDVGRLEVAMSAAYLAYVRARGLALG